MGGWKVKSYVKELSLRKPILIEGLPGIGNVGKVAADYIIDQLKAKKIYSFFSYSFPHSVFVNEKNLVELPRIEMYYKHWKGQDFLFLVGDVQPVDEQGSYEFTERILDLVQRFDVQEVITLGGIGLKNEPKNPKIYCTANSKKIIQRYRKGLTVNHNLYGVVGPIVGVSGIMLGLAKMRRIQAISFLAETYGHPMYLGLKGAREIVSLLNKKFHLSINLKKLDKDIKTLEEEDFDSENAFKEIVTNPIKKLKERTPGEIITYIG